MTLIALFWIQTSLVAIVLNTLSPLTAIVPRLEKEISIIPVFVTDRSTLNDLYDIAEIKQ